MAGFSVDHMKHKLAKLTSVPESIQTMSLWLLHHQKHHADQITSTWLSAICKETTPSKIINLMYLANDAIQNCRKKCPEFASKFFTVLEPALRHCSKIPNRDIAEKNRRIIGIFKQREIYKADKISRLENALVGKRVSIEERITEHKPSPIKYNLENINSACADVTDSLRKMIEPPSEDGETRQRLLNCPDIVGNPDKLVAIRSESEVDDYLQQLEGLEEPAKEYCKKLTAEMEQRRLLQKQLDVLLANVRAAVEYQESTLREIKKREDSVKHCVDQIQQVHDSLPDLDQMNTSQPLPSADLLFSSR